jgi:outer membrane lipoprotein-sorting protein
MLPALMLTAALSGAPRPDTPPDPLASAIEHYRTVESYRVTIHSTHANGEEHILYYYQKPGLVRMEFFRPHAGAVIIYNPHTQLVRLWPFGVGHFPKISLSPANPLIQSLSGQRVDQSDIGALFENIRLLQKGGSTTILVDTKNSCPGTRESLDCRDIVHLVVTGADGSAVANVHSSELWLDTASQFPVKVINRDLKDVIIETVLMETLEINIAPPDTLFNP